jgi:hypothetical protein
MSEPEKKGSPWPWILVPVAAVSLFFVLRECRQNLPPAETAPEHAAAAPASPGTPPAPVEAVTEAAPDSVPAPQPSAQ